MALLGAAGTRLCPASTAEPARSPRPAGQGLEPRHQRRRQGIPLITCHRHPHTQPIAILDPINRHVPMTLTSHEPAENVLPRWHPPLPTINTREQYRLPREKRPPTIRVPNDMRPSLQTRIRGLPRDQPITHNIHRPTKLLIRVQRETIGSSGNPSPLQTDSTTAILVETDNRHGCRARSCDVVRRPRGVNLGTGNQDRLEIADRWLQLDNGEPRFAFFPPTRDPTAVGPTVIVINTKLPTAFAKPESFAHGILPSGHVVGRPP